MATKKTNDLREQRRLENRWVFEQANRLMAEEDMSRKVAFRQANLTKELLGHLGQGVVTFEYKKQDGTLRTARGTLCHGVSAAYDAYEYKGDRRRKSDDESNFTYWDLDREAFRTFRAETVVRIIEIEKMRE